MAVKDTETSPPPRRRARWIALGVIAVLAAAAITAFVIANRTDERDEALQLARAGSFQDAIPKLQKQLELSPNDAEVLKELVACLTRTGAQESEIEPYCQRWREASPNDPEPFRIHYALLKKLSRQHEAIDAGERLLQLTPGDDSIRIETASLMFAVGRYADAKRECLRLNDSYVVPAEVVQITLARIHVALGDVSSAAPLVDSLAKKMPDDSAVLILRAQIAVAAGDDKQAADWFRRVKPRDRNERMTKLHGLATALAKLGQTDDAKQTFAELDRVTEADLFMTDAAQRKHDPAFQLKAARALADIGDFSDAAMILEILHTHRPPSRESLSLLADCRAGQGRTDEAKRLREQAAKTGE